MRKQATDPVLAPPPEPVPEVVLEVGLGCLWAPDSGTLRGVSILIGPDQESTAVAVDLHWDSDLEP